VSGPTQDAAAKRLGKVLDTALNPMTDQRRVFFVLLTASIDGGGGSFVSNGPTDAMIDMMKEFIARAEGRDVIRMGAK
jgi:hypothetical protein